MEKPEWYDGKGKEALSQAFIKNVLDSSGYTVKGFGIEQHSQEIIEKIKNIDYKSETKKKLSSIPDIVVIDENTKEVFLTEVKFQTMSFLSNPVALAYKKMDDYLQYWRETTLIVTSPSFPYCICVDVNKVDKEKHFKRYQEGPKGRFELWDFTTPKVFCFLHEKFPKVTEEKFNNQLHLLGVKDSLGLNFSSLVKE